MSAADAPPPPAECLDVAFWGDSAKVAALLNDPTIRKSEVAPWTGGGGASGDSYVLQISRELAGKDDETVEYFLKLTNLAKLGISKAVGLAREALVLRVAPSVPALARVAPKCLFAHGDMSEGKKVLAMHMVKGVQSGFFFGDHSPHNWKKDLAALTQPCPGVDEEVVCLLSAKVAAKLHAAAWGQEELLLRDPRFDSLRSRGWARGEDEESWKATHNWAVDGWAKAKESLMGAESKIKWDPLLVDVMDAGFEKTSWSTHQAEWGRLTKTLIHGDFHPANMMVLRRAEAAADAPAAEAYELVLLDWEVVGVGSGPQDLGQYLISHSTPASRRAIAPKMLATYVEALAAEGVELSAKAAEDEYVQGGLGRWMWLLPLLCGMEADWVQYFHDQVAAFIHDHGITPATAPIVRA